MSAPMEGGSRRETLAVFIEARHQRDLQNQHESSFSWSILARSRSSSSVCDHVIHLLLLLFKEGTYRKSTSQCS